MTEEDAFQAAIDAAPLDRLPRLVFCDWLDERGDRRADGMRVLVEFDRWPWVNSSGKFLWDDTPFDISSEHLDERNHHSDRCGLGLSWSIATDGNRCKWFESRRKAMDVAAMRWSRLGAKKKAKCIVELKVITGRVQETVST